MFHHRYLYNAMLWYWRGYVWQNPQFSKENRHPPLLTYIYVLYHGLRVGNRRSNILKFTFGTNRLVFPIFPVLLRGRAKYVEKLVYSITYFSDFSTPVLRPGKIGKIGKIFILELTRDEDHTSWYALLHKSEQVLSSTKLPRFFRFFRFFHFHLSNNIDPDALVLWHTH